MRRMEGRNPQGSSITFDHNHVDIDGTDGGLWQSLPLLQESRHVPGSYVVVGLLAIGEEFPACYTCTQNGHIIVSAYLLTHLHPQRSHHCLCLPTNTPAPTSVTSLSLLTDKHTCTYKCHIIVFAYRQTHLHVLVSHHCLCLSTNIPASASVQPLSLLTHSHTCTQTFFYNCICFQSN